MKLPPDQLVSEVIQRVSNAKTRDEKIEILRHYDSTALRSVLIWNFDPRVESVFPEGEVPYTPNDAPAGTEHTRLIHEWRKFNHFVKGVSDISQTKREVMYIQLLESLHQSEAEILCLIKDKQLHKRFKITKVVVQEAFPDIVWDWLMEAKINIIHRDCEQSAAKDKSLPLNSYIVSYKSKNRVMYDVVQGTRVAIFDHYYDQYRNLISMEWTDGKVSPKMYGYTAKKVKK